MAWIIFIVYKFSNNKLMFFFYFFFILFHKNLKAVTQRYAAVLWGLKIAKIAHY